DVDIQAISHPMWDIQHTSSCSGKNIWSVTRVVDSK
ncbi:hypothetical protein A2U01_0093362, partial [Trifolium medium]|nr:hypothetical protein [Trifolium medium]